VNDADLKATLTRVAAMGPFQLVATPLDARGIQPPAPKKKRAPRGQSLQAYMDAERGAR
jgi:hypothetical protein